MRKYCPKDLDEEQQRLGRLVRGLQEGLGHLLHLEEEEVEEVEEVDEVEEVEEVVLEVEKKEKEEPPCLQVPRSRLASPVATPTLQRPSSVTVAS